MSKAYGIKLVITSEQMKVLARTRRTHAKFFNIAGVFDMASRHYRLCNTLENKRHSRTSAKKSSSLDYVAHTMPVDIERYLRRIRSLNLSLVCIKKNEWNGHLSYNTLYFWLEHTVVVFMPLAINVVVAASMVNVFWRCGRYKSP